MLEDLFSFKGAIGRGQMWLIYFFVVMAAAFTPTPIYLSPRQIDFPAAGVLGGHDIVRYLHIDWPVPVIGIALICAYFLWMAVIFWIVAAAFVKRLHDRRRSGKWLALLVAGFVLQTVLSYFLADTGQAFILFDVIIIIFFAALCAIGAWGMFEVFLLPARSPAYSETKAGLRVAEMR